MVPDKEKLNKVYYTYRDNLKENNTRVIKYEKGDDFNNIEDILKYYPEFAQKVKRVKKNYNKKNYI